MALNFLVGKKVLVLDTETTGLPRQPQAYQYYPYHDTKYYDTSRILEIGWYYTDNYQGEYLVDDIKSFIRKPNNFDASVFNPPSIEKHGLTFDKTQSQGVPFKIILEDHGLCMAIKSAEYFVSYKTSFDHNILGSEIARLKKGGRLMLKNLDKIELVDPMLISTNICKLPNKNKPNEFKWPSLPELYEHFYHHPSVDQHRAKGDVITLLDCMIKMI